MRAGYDLVFIIGGKYHDVVLLLAQPITCLHLAGFAGLLQGIHMRHLEARVAMDVLLEQLVHQPEGRFGAIKEDGDLHLVGHVAQQLLGARRKFMLEILRPSMPLIMPVRIVVQRHPQRDHRQRGC